MLRPLSGIVRRGTAEACQIAVKSPLFCTRGGIVCAQWPGIRPLAAEILRLRFRPQFSTLIYASRMTGPHFSVSDFRKAASCAGVEPFGLAPRSSNRDFTG